MMGGMMMMLALLLYWSMDNHSADCLKPGHTACNCPDTESEKPVCGCDGQTYRHACEAECKVTSHKPGACQ